MNATVAGLLAILVCAACGTAPTLVQCKLDALRFLPKDPLMVTPYDAVDLIDRINACQRPADARAP